MYMTTKENNINFYL